MNKLVLSMFLLLPLSLNAMDNSHRLLISGTAAVAWGIGGHLLASKRNHQSFEQLKYEAGVYDRQRALNRYAIRSYVNGALRFGSYLTAGVSARYAYSGNLPPNNAQTYASFLAIIASGGMLEFAGIKRDLEQRPSNTAMVTLLSGIALGGLGFYGMYKNS